MLTKIHEYAAMYVQPSKMIFDLLQGKMLLCSPNKHHVASILPNGTGRAIWAFGLGGGTFGMAQNPTDGTVWCSLGGLEHRIAQANGPGSVDSPQVEQDGQIGATRPGEVCFSPDGTMYHATFAAGPGNPGNVWKGIGPWPPGTAPFYQGSRVVALAADDEGFVYVGDPNATELVKVDFNGDRAVTLSGVQPVEILVNGLELFVLMADRTIWRLRRDDLTVIEVHDTYDTAPLAATTLAIDGDGHLHLSGFAAPAVNGMFGAWVFEIS